MTASPSVSTVPSPPAPIDLYYWPTPNGWKIAIALEEMGLPYRLLPIDIGKGDQFAPAFLQLNPNHRIPVIVDPEGPAGQPLAVFESGAILQYLGRKSGLFYPQDPRSQSEVEQWLFWQVGGLGPMCGQAGHFKLYAPEPVPYAIERYTKEVARLMGVMERRLQDRDYLAGPYTIADMACWPWVSIVKNYDVDLAPFPRVQAWLDRLGQRPAIVRGRQVGAELRRQIPTDPAELEKWRQTLFGQQAAAK